VYAKTELHVSKTGHEMADVISTASPEALLPLFDLDYTCVALSPMRPIRPYRLLVQQPGGPGLGHQTASETRWREKRAVGLLNGETIDERSGPGQLQRENLPVDQQQ